jgi:hypothetical protein
VYAYFKLERITLLFWHKLLAYMTKLGMQRKALEENQEEIPGHMIASCSFSITKKMPAFSDKKPSISLGRKL